MNTLQNKIRSFNRIGEGNVSYDPHLCARYCADWDACGCKISSVLSLWGNDIASNMGRDITTEAIRDRITTRSAQDGIPVLQGVLGGINGVSGSDATPPDASTLVLESADAIQLTFEIDGTLDLDYSRDWQVEFLEQCNEFQAEAQSVDVWCGTKVSANVTAAYMSILLRNSAVATVPLLCYVRARARVCPCVCAAVGACEGCGMWVCMCLVVVLVVLPPPLLDMHHRHPLWMRIDLAG